MRSWRVVEIQVYPHRENEGSRGGLPGDLFEAEAVPKIAEMLNTLGIGPGEVLFPRLRTTVPKNGQFKMPILLFVSEVQLEKFRTLMCEV